MLASAAGVSGRYFVIVLGCDSQVRDHALVGGRARERRVTGEHFVSHHAHGVEIRARIDERIAHQLLGRHVARRADGQSDLRERSRRVSTRRLLDHAHDAEVGENRMSVLQEDVVGLEIAMHDAECVREGERVDDLAQALERLRRSTVRRAA